MGVILEFLFPLLGLVVGLAALIVGADRCVVGAAATARNLGVPPLLIGLTIVGVGTSAPEMLVSATAGWMQNSGLCIGNAIGSNITNVGLVLGVAALVRPLQVHSKVVRRELPLLLITMLAALGIMLDGDLGVLDGAMLLAGMVALLLWSSMQGTSDRKSDPLAGEFAEEIPEGMKPSRALLWLVVGFAGLLLGARLLVWGGVQLATLFGVSDLVIGLTVVAIGTSLPELAASVMSALKDEHDIAVGNVVGSNMFNLLGVLGLPGILAPGPFDRAILTRDFPVMFGLTVLLLAMTRGFRSESIVSRPKAAALVVLFLGYLVWLYFDATA